MEADGEIPCNSSMNLVYDTCTYGAISDQMQKEFACVVPWLPKDNNGAPRRICRFDNSSAEGIAWKDRIMARYDFLSSSGMSGLCPQPCATMEVFLGKYNYVAQG